MKVKGFPTMMIVRKMLTEQLACLGRVACRHRIPEDAIWDIAKGFEVLYVRACCDAGEMPTDTALSLAEPFAKPHPGIFHLLERVKADGQSLDLTPADALNA